jgi:hypothetical protein
MTGKSGEDTNGFDAEEAQRRFEKLVRTALNTPPKPMKDAPRKRPAPEGQPKKPTKPAA